MHSRIYRTYRPIRWMLVLTVTALLLAPLSASTQSAKAQTAGSGIVCTTSPTATFALNATDGYINLPDGNLVYMWSYADDAPGALAFQYPSPTLCVNEGDTVTITLNNNLTVDTSIMFPGQNNVLANGSPAQPEFNLDNEMTSLTDSVAPGGAVTYSFVADHPGTFIYESGTDAELQNQMGLVGALIVRPSPTGAFASGYAYNWAGSQHTPAEEFMLMISEIDPDIHLAVELGEPFTMTTYHPRYWLLNGRAFPDTILPNGTPWLPAQPYSALPHVEVMSATHTQPALIRYLNVGRIAHPWHPHGENGRVIGRDGYPLMGSGGEDLSYEEYLFDIGPGQTMDVTWKFTDVEGWSQVDNPVPGFDYQKQNLIRGELFGSPYLGATEGGLTGEVNFNQCGEFYHIWHTHAVFEVAAYGIPMGGMVTVVRIDPTNGCP